MMATGTFQRILKKLYVRKKSYVRNNIFKKRIPKMRFWIIYIFVQISFFGGLLWGALTSLFFFFIFCRWPTIVANIFTQPPTIKKFATALLFKCSKTKLKKIDIFKKEVCMIFPKSFFIFKKSYLFKINICIHFQKIPFC